MRIASLFLLLFGLCIGLYGWIVGSTPAIAFALLIVAAGILISPTKAAQHDQTRGS